MAVQPTPTPTRALLFALLVTSWHLQPSVSLSIDSLFGRSRIRNVALRHVSCNQQHVNNDHFLSRSKSRPWGTLASGSGSSSMTSLNSHPNTNNDSSNIDNRQDRRSFLEQSALSIVSSSSASLLGALPSTANARGLVRFPCTEPLLNTYHFLRAGSSLLEVEDIWSTNPLFLTNREAALSDIGEEEVRAACKYLKSGISSTPTVVRYSLAASSIDTANIVGEELRIGRDRLVPEFNYMDPRAIGAWDFAAKNKTEEAVWALDVDEAGPNGKGGKPPPNEDGTPAETLADQVVRLTNLMSVLETLYSGDTVLLVFPDGTGPALLSCLIGGIPLNRAHELQFCPGEIRCDVDYKSINALASQPPSQTYLDIIQRGREELKQLRADPDALRNVKDLKFEEEREQERKELEARKKEEAKAKELEMQRKREERIQRQNENSSYQSSVDGTSLGIAGVVVGGGAVALSAFGSEESSEEVLANGTQNTTATDTDKQSVFNATIPVNESEGESTEVDETLEEQIAMISNDSVSLQETIINEAAEEPSKSEVQDDLDFDDAWLVSISSIMNDSDGEDE